MQGPRMRHVITLPRTPKIALGLASGKPTDLTHVILLMLSLQYAPWLLPCLLQCTHSLCVVAAGTFSLTASPTHLPSLHTLKHVHEYSRIRGGTAPVVLSAVRRQLPGQVLAGRESW
jgi:hypothetical protein